jgi:hypothetical protein
LLVLAEKSATDVLASMLQIVLPAVLPAGIAIEIKSFTAKRDSSMALVSSIRAHWRLMKLGMSPFSSLFRKASHPQTQLL